MTWDLHTTTNFKNTGNNLADKFFNGDNVTFDGTASPNFALNLVGGLAPGSVTVNNPSGTYSFSGLGFIGGVGSLTKSGAGTLTLATNNLYAGGTILNAGTLNINNNGALGLPDATVTGLTISGGVLDNTSGQAVVQAGNPTQAWNVDIVFTGTNDLNLGAGAVTMSNLANSTNRVVTVNGSTLTIGGAIADGVNGNNGITKQGAGTLMLAGANTFTGPVTINQGTVKVGDGAALGSNTVPGTVVASGAALDFGGFASANVPSGISAPIKIAGTGVGGHGALTNSGANAQSNAILGTVTLTTDASVGGTSRFDIRGGGLVLAGHTLTKTDANQFNVANVNFDAGSIVINQGIFGIEGSSSIDTAGGSITVNSGGNLQFNGNTGTVTRAITLNGAATVSDVTPASQTATVGSNISLQGNATFASTNASTLVLSHTAPNSGVITESGGARSITKTGPGTLVLENATNNYSGGTNFNGGVVNIAALGSLGAGPLTFNGGGVQYAAGLIADITTRSITLNAGGGTIDSNGNNITLANGMSGSGGLTLKGNGATITLSGANTYGGSTTIATSVVLGAAGSLPSTTSLALDTTGGMTPTLDLNGQTTTITGLSRVATGGATIGNGSTTTASTLVFAGSASPSTFPGTIQDTVASGTQTTALTVNSGTLNLTGFNSYTGTTRVNGGTLALGTSGFLSATSPLVLGGGKFGTGGNAATFASLNVLVNSSIDFGNSFSTVTFTNGTASATWGGVLTVNNWTGNPSDPKLGGGSDQLLLPGLTNTQKLSQIKFDGYPFGAQTSINNSSEIVPSGAGYVLGDFDLSRTITQADVGAMLRALTNLTSFKSTNSLTDADLFVIGDFDHNNAITNGDIQGMLNLLAGLGLGSTIAVPEPATFGLLSLAMIGVLVLSKTKRERFAP